MKDRSVAKLLQLDAPKPRAEARLAARNAALVEFARVQGERAAEARDAAPTPAQGFWSRFRLSRHDTRDGRASMNWNFLSRTSLSAVASGGIAAFAIAVMWPMFRDHSEPELLPQRHAVQSRPVVAVPEPVAPPVAEPPQAHVSPEPNTTQIVKPVAPPRVVHVPSVVPVPEPMSQSATPLPAATATPSAHAGSAEAEEIVVTGERRAQTVMNSVSPVTTIVAEEIDDSRARPMAGAPRQPARGVVLGRTAQLKKADKLEMAPGAPPPAVAPPFFEAAGDDRFEHFDSNPIKRVAGADAVSTFSVDVDTASYSFARRMINEGRLPPKDAVRVEEMINYFDYAWPKPASRKVPFAATIAVSDSPWTKGKKLVHIGIKGYELDRGEVPDANLVFLVDVSGSMNSPDKLPLAVQSMKLLLQRLKPTDTVGIVVYAGAAGTVLEPTAVRDEDKILRALDALQAGGSTAGAEGIELAYQLAEKSFRKGGMNRVLLATDGDFNVGIDDTQQLKSFIERKREKGIFLSVLGFGEGNYRDELAQALAQNGNGVAAYIDTLDEAKKVLVEQSTGSLFTIAKDVKLQVEFNPRTVAEYRLVGYETRALKREDFNNDKVDAGDVGAGHTVTALYEITPVGSAAVSVDALRYQAEDGVGKDRGSRAEYGFLKIRYKLPDGDTSSLVEQPIPLETPRLGATLEREVRFSTAVAGFAQLLKGGVYTGTLSFEDVMRQAQGALGEDRNGHRTEFVDLVRKAMRAKAM